MSLILVPRSLQYFERVAQLGSIQAASRELGISASAIHRQITAIEDALGELLFERETRGMTLTPTGYHVLELARDWRLDNARLWSVIQADRGIEQGHIKIAAMDSMVNGFVPKLLGEITKLYPRVRVELEIMSPDNAVKGVLNGDFDFAAVVNVAPDDKLNVHWSHDFPLGCIAAPNHPLARKSSIKLVDATKYPIVFQSAALTIRKLLEAHHAWIFDRSECSVVVNSIQLMKILVTTGQYVAFTSELDAGPEIRSERLKFIPISDTDIFSQRFSLISNILIPETPVAKQIIATSARILRDEVGTDQVTPRL